MRLKVRLTGSWASSPNEDGPATFVRRASAEPGALQVSWAEYGGGPLPNPTPADLEDLAKKFGREQGFGDPTDSDSGACAFGAFGSAAFRTSELAWIRLWFLSNGRDFINVTHVCETDPDPAERAEADEIARSLSLGPGDPDAPSTITRRGDRDDCDDDPDRQEIDELTALMRTHPRWRDVRDCLVANGHAPASVLLADLLEEDDGRQYGVIVTRGRRVLRFVRVPVPEDVTGTKHVTSFREITHRPRRIAFVRERVEAALAMIDDLPASPDASPAVAAPATARAAPAGGLRGWIEKLVRRTH